MGDKNMNFSIELMVRKIYYSKQPLMVLFKFVFLLSLILLTVSRLVIIFSSFDKASIYSKDILQEYLMTDAVRQNKQLYRPLIDLAQESFGLIGYFPHPSPHPPPVILLFLMFSNLKYEHVALIWLLIELIILVYLAIYISRKIFSRINVLPLVFIIIFLLGWPPITEDLYVGQLSLLLSLLIIGFWESSIKNHDWIAGSFLGFAISLKLFLWPVLVFTLLIKRWRIFTMGLSLFFLLNIFTIPLIGFDQFLYYYSNVSSIVLPYYDRFIFNLSLWSVIARTFRGTGSILMTGIRTPPLINYPNFESVASIILIAIIIIFCIWLSRIKSTYDFSISIMIIISVLISPITWIHYFILFVIPWLVSYKAIKALSFPKLETISFLVISILLFIPNNSIREILYFLSGNRLGSDIVIPFYVASISFLPILEAIFLLLLLIRLLILSKQKQENTSFVPGFIRVNEILL